jgi:hypothetical protein
MQCGKEGIFKKQEDRSPKQDMRRCEFQDSLYNPCYVSTMFFSKSVWFLFSRLSFSSSSFLVCFVFPVSIVLRLFYASFIPHLEQDSSWIQLNITWVGCWRERRRRDFKNRIQFETRNRIDKSLQNDFCRHFCFVSHFSSSRGLPFLQWSMYTSGLNLFSSRSSQWWIYWIWSIADREESSERRISSLDRRDFIKFLKLLLLNLFEVLLLIRRGPKLDLTLFLVTVTLTLSTYFHFIWPMKWGYNAITASDFAEVIKVMTQEVEKIKTSLKSSTIYESPTSLQTLSALKHAIVRFLDRDFSSLPFSASQTSLVILLIYFLSSHLLL